MRTNQNWSDGRTCLDTKSIFTAAIVVVTFACLDCDHHDTRGVEMLAQRLQSYGTWGWRTNCQRQVQVDLWCDYIARVVRIASVS